MHTFFNIDKALARMLSKLDAMMKDIHAYGDPLVHGNGGSKSA